jgi:hypothetical protein
MRKRLLLAPFLFVALTFDAFSQQAWKTEQLDASSLPGKISPDVRPGATQGLPDGRVALGGNKSTIRRAWYSRPTTRYTHGILGDRIEGGSLVIVTPKGLKLEYLLPKNEVFEDITPRLADLDGDGKTEIIAIVSSVTAGASLNIFQLDGNRLVRRARNSYIGRAFRWLNIAGINRYTGARSREIAIVVTPHIGGRLDLYKFDGKRLIRIASRQGFSNHVIGSREQRLSASYRATGGRKTNLALPSADRSTLKIMSIGPKGWQQIGRVSLPSPIDKAILVSGSGENVKFTVGLSDGSVYSVSQR